MAGEAPKSEKKRRFDHSSDLGGLEASVEDLISSVCDSESKEGAWMSDYDIVKRGTALKLESQVGGDTVGGHCRRECRTECRRLAPDGDIITCLPLRRRRQLWLFAAPKALAEGARRRRSPWPPFSATRAGLRLHHLPLHSGAGPSRRRVRAWSMASTSWPSTYSRRRARASRWAPWRSGCAPRWPVCVRRARRRRGPTAWSK